MKNTRYVTRTLYAALAVLVAATMAVPSAQAQMYDEPLTSDRPGFSNAAATLQQGAFQTELGYSFANTADVFGDESASSHNLGQLLLRYGVTDAFELRANVGSYEYQEVLDPSLTNPSLTDPETTYEGGYFGPSVEAKARLFRNETSTLSAFSSTLLPVQTGFYDSNPDQRAIQTLALLLDGQLGTGVSLTINGGTQFYWDGGVQEDRQFSALFIPTLNFAINDQVGAYVGYYGEYTEFANTNFVEGGLTFLANENTQLDLNTGYRVDDNLDQFFIGLGLSQRF
ncbi:transporter [Longibacter salinarum]|nr:transporter [Longibacter salinarum]